ncbi:unnamed protein product [Effrenium voratum]|nr:unnamed protein product [Effrenium voratum]
MPGGQPGEEQIRICRKAAGGGAAGAGGPPKPHAHPAAGLEGDLWGHRPAAPHLGREEIRPSATAIPVSARRAALTERRGEKALVLQKDLQNMEDSGSPPPSERGIGP